MWLINNSHAHKILFIRRKKKLLIRIVFFFYFFLGFCFSILFFNNPILFFYLVFFFNLITEYEVVLRIEELNFIIVFQFSFYWVIYWSYRFSFFFQPLTLDLLEMGIYYFFFLQFIFYEFILISWTRLQV